MVHARRSSAREPDCTPAALQDRLTEVDILLRDLPGPMRELVGVCSVDGRLDIDRLRGGIDDLRVALDSGLGKAGGAGRTKNHALYALVSRLLVVFAAYSEEPPNTGGTQ